MKRRKKRPSQSVGRRLALVEFMDVAIAVAETDGQLYLVRVFPDGSAEEVGPFDRPGTGSWHCYHMLRHAVETAYGMVQEQEQLSRFRRNFNGPLECPFDDPDAPASPLGPHENN